MTQTYHCNLQNYVRGMQLIVVFITGFHVLDKLGIEVEVYYASEIDEAAQNVSETNFGSRITWIGDVTTFTDKQARKRDL